MVTRKNSTEKRKGAATVRKRKTPQKKTAYGVTSLQTLRENGESLFNTVENSEIVKQLEKILERLEKNITKIASAKLAKKKKTTTVKHKKH